MEMLLSVSSSASASYWTRSSFLMKDRDPKAIKRTVEAVLRLVLPTCLTWQLSANRSVEPHFTNGKTEGHKSG
jgi:hypothetical protein